MTEPASSARPSLDALRERVAQAIYESDRYARHNSEPWSTVSETTRNIYLRNASAALRAVGTAAWDEAIRRV